MGTWLDTPELPLSVSALGVWLLIDSRAVGLVRNFVALIFNSLFRTYIVNIVYIASQPSYIILVSALQVPSSDCSAPRQYSHGQHRAVGLWTLGHMGADQRPLNSCPWLMEGGIRGP